MTIQNSMKKDLSSKKLFELAKKYAYEYLDNCANANVYPNQQQLKRLEEFNTPLGTQPTPAEEVLRDLHEIGSPATVLHTCGRYFGFIIGGATPVSLGTKWLTDVWDQCGGLYVSSPVNAIIESVCEKWLIDLFQLPPASVVGFVSGGSMANFSAMVAARYHLLRKLGWDVNKKGLNGAPKIRLVTHRQIHASIRKNLVLMGFGDEQIEYVRSDDQGRMIVGELPKLDETCLVFLQAGNANTGSFDDFETVCRKANMVDAWVHIDGAFGLWAAASDRLRHLTKGIEQADSWAVDAHKSLNVPYDSGLVMCRHPDAMINSLHAKGEYFIYSQQRDPMLFTPEMSKRSRAFELWATMKNLGKSGISEMILAFHERARQMEAGLKAANFNVINEVVFNQVLFSMNNDDLTEALIQKIQKSGECWLGGTSWNGKKAIRVSISCWQSTDQDIQHAIRVFKKARKELVNR